MVLNQQNQLNQQQPNQQQQNQQGLQMRPVRNRNGQREAQLFYEFADEFGRRPQQPGAYQPKNQSQNRPNP